MPYINDKVDWKVEKHKVKELILKKIAQNGYKIENNIQVEKIFTPLDLYYMHLSNKGSIYGISSNGKMNAFKRPANRNRQLEGLYFATGSAHPGGGIPLVILSGKHCADLINRKYN
jgi:phytoene desaturase